MAKSSQTDVLDDALARADVSILNNAAVPDYTALAKQLVVRTDRILAVWDGEPGRPGGTGSVVRYAHTQGKPVLHIPLEMLK